MADFSVQRFNWLPSPTAWQQNQAWQERRAALRADFEAANSDVSGRLLDAFNGAITGKANLAGQAALKRIKAAANAKLAAGAALDRSV